MTKNTLILKFYNIVGGVNIAIIIIITTKILLLEKTQLDLEVPTPVLGGYFSSLKPMSIATFAKC